MRDDFSSSDLNLRRVLFVLFNLRILGGLRGIAFKLRKLIIILQNASVRRNSSAHLQ